MFLNNTSWKVVSLSFSLVMMMVAFASGCFAMIDGPKGEAYRSSKGWIITASKAHGLYKEGALFLDLRTSSEWKKRHVKGAAHTTWQYFSEAKAPYQGRLLASNSTLTQRLRSLGVSAGRPVVVYGNPIAGWGEDGRIVWMLRTLGHTKAYLVDGGYSALAAQKLPLTNQATPPAKGTFTARRTSQWAIDSQGLQKEVSDKRIPAKVAAVDTREKREYLGATPYGEKRGGHVPGAVHIHYRELLNRFGYLLPREQIIQKLRKLGITADKKIVAYCTGGVRSGWFVVLLADLGFTSVKNYAGSMWEWAAGPVDRYPLQK